MEAEVAGISVGLRTVTRALVALAAMFALSGPALAAPAKPAAPSASRCADPCTCKGPEGGIPPRVDARAVTACMIAGRPLALQRVHVTGGDLDLSQLPCASLDGRSKVPGVVDPRAGLGLVALEQKTGQQVPGTRLVAATVAIEDAVVEGHIRGPALGVNARVYCPVTFLQTVSLNGSVVRGEVRLPHARFRRPVSMVAATFERAVDLRAATFAENAHFVNARFAELFARDADFARVAAFRGMDVSEEGGFESVLFRGEASFGGPDESRRLRRMDFSEARFGKEARFEGAQFVDDTRFGKATCEDAAWFTGARFLGPAHFDGTRFGARATFSSGIFDRLANFLRTTFDGKLGVFFGNTQFRDEARFLESRFGGPAEFASAKFTNAQFLNAAFGDSADFRDAVFDHTAEFGGDNTRTVFLGPVSFAFATIAVANFENAYFRAPASFAGTKFGNPEACPKRPAIVANLWGASFDDAVNFQGATFRGGVNLSHTTMAPGRARLRWSQLDGMVQSDSVILSADPDCKNLRQFRAAANRPAMPRADVFAWLERNFRSLEQLRDANAAFYNMAEEETTAALAASTSYLEAMGPWLWRWGYGRTAGYGVFPGRVAILIVAVLIAFAFVYSWSSLPLRFGTDAPRMAFKVTELPWRADAAAPPGVAGRRWVLALVVSTAALLSVRVWGGHLADRPRAWKWWVILGAEHVLGYVLLVLLAMTIARSVPGVEKFLTWLL